MGDVIEFQKRKVSEKPKGNSLCRSGFHKWEILKEKKFAVKMGKLVTVAKCKRCGKIANKLL